MRSILPNAITLLNLLCGSIACIYAVHNQLELAALYVVVGIFFDFFDGFAARSLGVTSNLGLQLDSLADMVTSGLVPGIVMFQLLDMALAGGWNTGLSSGGLEEAFGYGWQSYVPFLGFGITLASAYRLAKFNIDENQVDTFVGLPTPANALAILSLPMILLYHQNEFLHNLILNPWFLVVLTLLSCYMLNARIPLFALKFKNWSFKDNAQRYLFLILAVVLLLTLKFMAIPAIVVLYVGWSLVTALKRG